MGAPDKKFAARLVDLLYQSGDSPLRYKINRLGGRSKQEKWILQAELFNELHKWATADWKQIAKKSSWQREAERYYDMVRDFFKAAEKAWGPAWGSATHMVTRPVTLKAMLRVCIDLAHIDADPSDRQKRWERRLSSWGEHSRNFRSEGFYERFPAKGQVERVARIHRDLGRIAGIEPRKRKGDVEPMLLAGGRR